MDQQTKHLRLTPGQEKILLQLIKGKTSRQIARETGVKMEAVSWQLSDAREANKLKTRDELLALFGACVIQTSGYTVHDGRTSKKPITLTPNEFLSLRAQGLIYKEIGEIHGVDKIRIRYWAKKHNLSGTCAGLSPAQNRELIKLNRGA